MPKACWKAVNRPPSRQMTIRLNAIAVCLLAGFVSGVWSECLPAGTPRRQGVSCLPYHQVILSVPQESSGETLIADITIPDIMTSTVIENGQVFRKIDLRGCGRTSEVGKPGLPSGGFLVAVPEGAQIAVEVLDTERAVRETRRVFPVP